MFSIKVTIDIEELSSYSQVYKKIGGVHESFRRM